MRNVTEQKRWVHNLRDRGILSVLLASFTVNLGISAAKAIYGWKTQTLVFVADAIHSFSDALAIIIGLVSVHLASQPPDVGHPYGHRKFEPVAALILAVLLLVTAYEIATVAFHRLLEPEVFPSFGWSSIVILLVALSLNFSISRWEARAAVTFNSQFLAADALHNKSDAMTALGIIASLGAIKYHVPYVDAVASLLITTYLGYLGIRLVRKNMAPLVDQSVLDPSLVERIACQVPHVLACHNVRSRGESDHYFVDLNIHLPADFTLEKAHSITHQVVESLKAAFPGLVDVVIHTEPHGHVPCVVEGTPPKGTPNLLQGH